MELEHGVGALRWLEAVHDHFLVRRTDAYTATDALPTQRVGPRQVEMHDDAGVLEVDPFSEQIGGEQQSYALMWRRRWAALRYGCEAGEGVSPGDWSAGNPGALTRECPDSRDV